MKSTEYAVYRITDEDLLEHVSSVPARSARAAVRDVAKTAGRYIAIPCRSLAVHVVKTETKTVVTVS